jgi:7-carboxy-7-deazaguanine synthase
LKIYTVKEIFETVQGEGAYSGVPATFVRFAGCNLWSGRNEDRHKTPCHFCDTDFVGGAKYDLWALITEIAKSRPSYVVLTGGEPGLQVDRELVFALRDCGKTVAIETNGTINIKRMGLDWVCVSPKTKDIKVNRADELKLVYPNPAWTPEEAEQAIQTNHKWLSPVDGPDYAANVALCVDYCTRNPSWRVNAQAHKLWGVR